MFLQTERKNDQKDYHIDDGTACLLAIYTYQEMIKQGDKRDDKATI